LTDANGKRGENPASSQRQNHTNVLFLAQICPHEPASRAPEPHQRAVLGAELPAEPCIEQRQNHINVPFWAQNCPHEPFLRLKTAPRPSKMSIPALGLRLCGHRADLKVACLAAAEQQQAAASVLPPGAGIMPPAIFCMTGPVSSTPLRNGAVAMHYRRG